MLENLSKNFVKNKNLFLTVSPNPINIFKFKWIKYVFIGKRIIKEVINVKNNKSISQIIGEEIGTSIIQRVCHNHVRYSLSVAFNAASMYQPKLNFRGLGATRRSWIDDRDKGPDGRIIKDLVMVYHDASIKHVDVHLGHLSLVYRITGKPVEEQIKYNSKGELTEVSKQALIDHVRSEIKNNSRVPWNHDHTKANARVQWAYDPTIKSRVSYGSGPTRQIIMEDKVEFYHPKVTSSLHMYAPAINPNQGLYIYQIYPGTDKSAPILIWGNLIPRDVKFQDRLHLKMIQENEYDQFLKKSDISTITRKYDGASCYFNGSGDSAKAHSFKFFSPRISKITGHRIEYTYKVSEMCDIGTSHKVEGIGELLFWKRTLLGNILTIGGIRRGPEIYTWTYLKSSEIGGVLNSNKVRPRNIFPELRIYRMDKWDENNTYSLPFFENRKYQKRLVKECPCKNWDVVKLVKPSIIKSWEGLVSVPEGESINNGYKIKWKGDEKDWRIDSINFYLSEKQNIAGVINCTSLESGKKFNLGPGQVGSVDRCLDILNNKEEWIGKVLKVVSVGDQDGRAAKVVDIHLDK